MVEHVAVKQRDAVFQPKVEEEFNVSDDDLAERFSREMI